MSFLTRDELDKHLQKLPRHDQTRRSPTSTPPKLTSTLKGPRPPVKPAAFRSASIHKDTSPASSSSSSSPTQRSYKDLRDDLVYPMQKKLTLSQPSEGDAFEAALSGSKQTKPLPKVAQENSKIIQKKEISAGPRVSVPNPLYTGIRCAGCDKAISGSTITAADRVWHASCFKCQHCKQDLEHVAFSTHDGQPYCALDYHELFSARCDYCKTPIEEKSIQALGKHYHEGHFFCRECGKPFTETDAFMVHDGHPYCDKDYLAKFGRKCMGCGEYLGDEILTALGGEWHKQCFVCADCGKAFSSATFYERNNKPFCEEHCRPVHRPQTWIKPQSSDVQQPQSSIKRGMGDVHQPETLTKVQANDDRKRCHRCSEAIEGRIASAFGKDYHPSHFQCARCDKLLSVRVPGMWQEGESGQVICRLCARAESQ